MKDHNFDLEALEARILLSGDVGSMAVHSVLAESLIGHVAHVVEVAPQDAQVGQLNQALAYDPSGNSVDVFAGLSEQAIGLEAPNPVAQVAVIATQESTSIAPGGTDQQAATDQAKSSAERQAISQEIAPALPISRPIDTALASQPALPTVANAATLVSQLTDTLHSANGPPQVNPALTTDSVTGSSASSFVFSPLASSR